MRWTRGDAPCGAHERLNDVVEDAAGRWWIGGQVVYMSEDRGATWRVAFDHWGRSLAADERGVWVGAQDLWWSPDSVTWEKRSSAFGEIRALSCVDGWLYRSSTFENTKADVCGGRVARSRDGREWELLLELEWGNPGRVVAWGDELLVDDDNCRHRSIDGGAHWTDEYELPMLSLWGSREPLLYAHGDQRRWRSTDRGRTWIAIEPELTRLGRVIRLRDGSWLAVGDDGVVMHGFDDGTA